MRRERRMNPKCLGGSVPDNFSARSAHLTGLKMRRITRGASFDHLVGALLQNPRHIETERLGRLEVDDQLELSRRLNRQLAWLFAFENAIDIRRRLPIDLDLVNPIGEQPTGVGESTERIDRRQAMAGR